MRNHGKAQLNKIMGIRTIRKRDTQPRDPHARSNLEKVSRTKVPPKRRYIHSSKKGKQSKERSRESSQSSPEIFQKDDSASDPSEEFEIDTSNLPSRRSQRIRTRTTPCGTEPDDIQDSISENESQPPMKKFSGIANFQAPQAEQAQPITAAPRRSMQRHQLKKDMYAQTSTSLQRTHQKETMSCQHDRAMTKESSIQTNSNARSWTQTALNLTEINKNFRKTVSQQLVTYVTKFSQKQGNVVLA